METQRENAKIIGTHLGPEDHGIFTASISLEFDGARQSFGGYYLKGEATYIFVSGVLDAVGVAKWEALIGTHVRVEKEGYRGPLTRIGHIVRDQWFCPKEALAALENSE